MRRPLLIACVPDLQGDGGLLTRPQNVARTVCAQKHHPDRQSRFICCKAERLLESRNAPSFRHLAYETRGENECGGCKRCQAVNGRGMGHDRSSLLRRVAFHETSSALFEHT
jgi:hypothetical protein